MWSPYRVSIARLRIARKLLLLVNHTKSNQINGISRIRDLGPRSPLGLTIIGDLRSQIDNTSSIEDYNDILLVTQYASYNVCHVPTIIKMAAVVVCGCLLPAVNAFVPSRYDIISSNAFARELRSA